MEILITGATGFVGQALMPLLLEKGHRLRVLSRNPQAAADRLPSGVRAFAWTGAAEAPPAEALDGTQAVIHLIGESIAGRWSAKRKKRIYDSRATATARLVEALPDSVTAFLCASAVGYYPSDPRATYDESFVHTNPNDFMGRVVVDWEAAATEARRATRRVVRLRIGLVLGDGGLLGTLLPIFRLGLGGPLGDGSNWVSWIHIQDLVALIALALEKESLDGPINLTAPGAVRFSEFSRTLAGVLHRPAFFRVPEFALRMALGEAAALPLASQHVVPAVAQQLGFEFRYPDLRPALEDLLGK